MKRPSRLASASTQRRAKARFSPVPAYLPYHEGGVSPVPRRSLSPNSKHSEGERHRSRRPIRANSPSAGRVACVFPCSPTNESFLTLDGHDSYESQYIDCKAKLSNLQQAYSQVMKEKLSLLSWMNKSSTAWKETSTASIQSFERSSEYREMADEVEDLHALLSSSHASINQLQQQFTALARKVCVLQRDLGILKYQSELHEATKEVKGTLVPSKQLEEVLRKRTEDLNEMVGQIADARRRKAAAEEQIASLNRENQSLVAAAKDLQPKCPDLLPIAETCQQLAVATTRLKLSEEKVRTLEEFIQSHSKHPLC